MKNFLILQFLIFMVFLLISFLAPDRLFIFFMIYMGYLIGGICLIAYLGFFRAMIVWLGFTILPFIFEYYLSLARLPFIGNPTIAYLSHKSISLPLTVDNLILFFSLPLLLICSLFFSKKLNLLINLKNSMMFTVIFPAIFFSLQFLTISPKAIQWDKALKWLIVSLAIYFISHKLMKFRPKIEETFKELPAIILLLIYGFNYVTTSNYYFLIIAGFFSLFYFISLYNEHKYQMISSDSD